jgi:hypothetical protein
MAWHGVVRIDIEGGDVTHSIPFGPALEQLQHFLWRLWGAKLRVSRTGLAVILRALSQLGGNDDNLGIGM